MGTTGVRGVKDIRAITLDEADEWYGLRSRFALDHASGDDEVVLVEGAARVTDLPLDFRALDSWTGLPKRSPDAFLGVVVDGDLTVVGHVANREGDFGPFLWVRGGLRAGNLATAGSHVLIEGGLTVERTVVGTHPHGRTVVRGPARAEVVFSEWHLTEFHGALTAELVVSRRVRVADPGRVRVNGWVGEAHDLDGEPVPGLGTVSTRAFRALDPALWPEPGAREVLTAVETGRSLLRPPGPRRAGPPDSGAERAREVLRRAGCREADPWDDGFRVRDDGDADAGRLEVSFAMADRPDPSPGVEPLDESVESRRYAAALTAAGARVAVDPEDEDVLHVWL
ncbi:hypothetical protein JNUCC64_02860 [Streptomyces sp. JNUCC 64]